MRYRQFVAVLGLILTGCNGGSPSSGGVATTMSAPPNNGAEISPAGPKNPLPEAQVKDTTHKTDATEQTFATHDRAGNTIAVLKEVNGRWKTPDGNIWGFPEGVSTNEALHPDKDGIIVDSPATKYCAERGGRLPSIQDYLQLMSYFDHYDTYSLNSDNLYLVQLTDLGDREFLETIGWNPGYGPRFFWTSSTDPKIPSWQAPIFQDEPQPGNFSNTDRGFKMSIRCIYNSN